MINFRQKEFTEYDAMHSLYNELIKFGDKNKYKVIDQRSLIPILKGNNIVIERFVITTSFGRKDRYRMYLKIGAKAKMPDDVRLPQRVYDTKLLKATLNIGASSGGGGDNNKEKETTHSERIMLFEERTFGGKNKNKNNNNNNNGGGDNVIKAGFGLPIDISYEVKELLGDAIKYDKADRSLVLEFNTIGDAIRALNILPFGISYNIYLLS